MRFFFRKLRASSIIVVPPFKLFNLHRQTLFAQKVIVKHPTFEDVPTRITLIFSHRCKPSDHKYSSTKPSSCSDFETQLKHRGLVYNNRSAFDNCLELFSILPSGYLFECDILIPSSWCVGIPRYTTVYSMSEVVVVCWVFRISRRKTAQSRYVLILPPNEATLKPL